MDKISLNSTSLNDLLGGGIETGIITNFYGPAGAGKTNLAIQSIVSCIKSGKKAYLIDAEGGFSVERFMQMHDKEALKNLILAEPKTFTEQNTLIEELEKEIEKTPEVGIIVVDSIVALYRLELKKDKYSEINRLLSKQFALLSKLAREYKLSVIVTNQVYNDFETGDIELVGRDIPKYFSKCLVSLEKIGNSKRKATLMKHRSRPEGISAEFEIRNEGLFDTQKKFGIF